MDALRTAVSAWGAAERPALAADRRAGARAHGHGAVRAGRVRAAARTGKEPVEPDPELDLPAGFLYQLTGETPDPAAARALDAYFVVGRRARLQRLHVHGARDHLHAVGHRAAPCAARSARSRGRSTAARRPRSSSQLHEIGRAERAEKWIDDALDRGERLMGFGHRVYRAYDPRAAALRQVAEGMASTAEWLSLAVAVEDIALRKLAERHPDRPLKTNVEYYAAAVLQGVGLPPTCSRPRSHWLATQDGRRTRSSRRPTIG